MYFMLYSFTVIGVYGIRYEHTLNPVLRVMVARTAERLYVYYSKLTNGTGTKV